MIVPTNAKSLEFVRFFSIDTLELYGDILQPWGQLETPGLVLHKTICIFLGLERECSFGHIPVKYETYISLKTELQFFDVTVGPCYGGVVN